MKKLEEMDISFIHIHIYFLNNQLFPAFPGLGLISCIYGIVVITQNGSVAQCIATMGSRIQACARGTWEGKKEDLSFLKGTSAF